jgi:hypothetical protein
MEEISMFIDYQKTKEEFIASGLTSIYTDKIVLIKGDKEGKGKCIYSRGKFFGDFQEFLENTNYVKGVKINGDLYNAIKGGGYLAFAAKDPVQINLNDTSNSIEISLTKEFLDKSNTPFIYTIEPSFNSIHLNNRGKLNTTSLDVWVNIDGESHIRLTDQYNLDLLGLSVWYSIDDDSNRHKLVVGGQPLIEVEEGGAIIISENDDSIFITLESETIDISAIRDKINLYLIKEADSNGYGYELNKIYIPVTKDGGSYRTITNINGGNLSNYTSNNGIDIEKCSSFINLESNTPSTQLVLPSIYPTSTNSNPFEVRKLLGSILCVYNNSRQTCMINGNIKNGENNITSCDLRSNNFAYFTCKCRVTNNKEEIYWEGITGEMS